MKKRTEYFIKTTTIIVFIIDIFLITFLLNTLLFKNVKIIPQYSRKSRIIYLQVKRKDFFKDIPKKKLDDEGYIYFKATAYDNSPEDQGIWVNQTATGFSLKGLSRKDAQCIAVDPKIIPLKSEVHIIFPEPYAHFSGIYYARDVGEGIKGKHIDLFLGDGVAKQDVRNFSIRKVKIKILKKG